MYVPRKKQISVFSLLFHQEVGLLSTEFILCCTEKLGKMKAVFLFLFPLKLIVKM